MRGRIAFVMLMLLPAVSPAVHLGDLYVIPVAGHVQGANGSLWQTDVAIHNFQDAALTVELAVVESGQTADESFFQVDIGGETPVTIPARGSRIFRDVLDNHRGRSNTIGALIVAADAPFAVSSRTYNVAAGVTTAGLSVPPTHEFLSDSIARAFVPGLTSSAAVRTNLGFTAAAGAAAPLVIEVALVDRAGTTLGSRTFTVPAGAIHHLQIGSGVLSTAMFDEATAVVRIVSGSGDVVAYGSVIENATNQAIFIGGTVPSPASAGAADSTFASSFQRVFQ